MSYYFHYSTENNNYSKQLLKLGKKYNVDKIKSCPIKLLIINGTRKTFLNDTITEYSNISVKFYYEGYYYAIYLNKFTPMAMTKDYNLLNQIMEHALN